MSGVHVLARQATRVGWREMPEPLSPRATRVPGRRSTQARLVRPPQRISRTPLYEDVGSGCGSGARFGAMESLRWVSKLYWPAVSQARRSSPLPKLARPTAGARRSPTGRT
jgi:hypothetical protein